jgi:DNA-binding NarL/FixJ family response regulator
VRVLIPDPNSIVTAGVRCFLEKQFGYQVVGNGHLGPGVLDQAKRSKPDLLLISLQSQGYDAIPVLRRIIQRADIPSVLLLENTSKEYVALVLKTGVNAVLPQYAALSELKKAINSALRRRTYLSPALPAASRQMAKKVLAGQSTVFDRLTDRQRSILKLIAEGKNTKEIAARLKISIKTVEFHRVRLMTRLEIYNVPGLVRFALRAGLVQMDV